MSATDEPFVTPAASSARANRRTSCLELAEGDPALAEDQRLAVAVAPGDVGDEPAEGDVLLVGVETEIAGHRQALLIVRRDTGSDCPAPDDGGRRHARVGGVDLPVGEPLEHLFQDDPALEAGQRGAEAEVDPVPEARCWPIGPVDVEAVRVVEAAVVAVGGVVQEEHGAARGHGLAVQLDVPGDVAAGDRARRLEPQQLLDGVADERRVLGDLAALVGVVAEDLAGPADEPVRRLVAGAGDDVDVEQRLVAGERAGDAVLVLERRRQQVGHDVVGRDARRASRCTRRRCRTASSPGLHFDPFENRMGLPGSVRR